MWCDPKSYNRYYVHCCVTWILEVIANDPCAGLLMTASVAYLDSRSG